MVAGFEIAVCCCGTVAAFEFAAGGGSFEFTNEDCIVVSFVLATKSDAELDFVVTGAVTSFEFDMGGCVVACLVFALESGMVLTGFDGIVICLESAIGGGIVGDLGNCIVLGFGFVTGVGTVAGFKPTDGANGT